MESWLSGRRRTIGNRVGVMSVSRVQIPDSPPDKSTETSRFSAFSFHFRSFLVREVLGNIFDSNSDSIGEFADIYRDSENNHTKKRLI